MTHKILKSGSLTSEELWGECETREEAEKLVAAELDGRPEHRGEFRIVSPEEAPPAPEKPPRDLSPYFPPANRSAGLPVTGPPPAPPPAPKVEITDQEIEEARGYVSQARAMAGGPPFDAGDLTAAARQLVTLYKTHGLPWPPPGPAAPPL